MYDELKNPDVTCKGLFETAIAYLVTAVVSGAFWIYHIQKDKKTVVVEESAFELSKKRFHFATTNTDTTVPLLKAQLMSNCRFGENYDLYPFSAIP
ncbi:hypothetical protein JH06_3849 [Blastocystis sp. subtype 4]|uniref:hypothetical protein n=1 Tax=Blastocystis sp. subtype 4 TaxID=944170 RepID=UPI000711F91A|nr:hypothetical protein JH06_3849 [Blastocystis sp. subtype 4]KNB42930.1 hypothetical protein JH06_3849 [Blastocystis sp. subtype 4]|eukprot:XP_014526373.1 hypothetical protein JH06_3849 [Blastocystis sp. subtype 4]